MARYRYLRWDGTQDPLGVDLPTDALVARLSEDLLDGRSIDESVRRMLRRGLPGRFDGLDRLAERIRRLREAWTGGGERPDPLAAVRRRLEEIVDLERAALAAEPSEEARFAELALDALPDNVADRIRELREHPWRSAEARDAFEALLDDLRRDILDAAVRRIGEGLAGIGPEEMAALKDMLSELNAMLERHAAGTGPSQAEFDEFMQRHGRFFPENPRTFEELLGALARRAAAFSRLMASISPEQRRQLEALVEDLLGDFDLAFEVDRLGANLRTLVGSSRWDRPTAMGGEPLGLGESLDALEELSRLEELERSLSQDYPGASLEDVDTEALRDALGDGAVADLERLRRIERMLEEAGVVTRSEGKLRLTPRGVRKLGERALAKVFDRLVADRPGAHDVAAAGGSEELTGSSRPWRFGDPFRLDLRRTLHNAVVRAGPVRGPLRLVPDDFEVAEAERRTSVATVLLLDMSRSMPLRGHWLPAKRMALALHTLIATSYPEDRLAIVGFSDYAREMTTADLAEVDWEPVYGTNMEHAFNLAGRILARFPDADRQVLLVTDGEPTAHLEGEYVFFNWPPVRETIERTVREALRLARSGVTMNIFMLERSPGLVDFVDRLARVVSGRVFAVPDADLGAVIVGDYVRRR